MSSLANLSTPSRCSKVESSIYFMRKEDLHQHEKPYAFRYVAEIDFPHSNFIVEPYENVAIEDLRGQLNRFSIQENGFAVLKLPREIPYESYYDPSKVQTYFDQLQILLREHLGASHVKVFRYSIRKRHPKFPLSTGQSYDFDQPTSVAHIDTTPAETLEEVKRQHGIRAEPLLQKRVQWINIWKPLRGPLNDWPLTVCDTRTVDPSKDLEQADLLFEHHVAENFQVHYSPHHQWYYLSDHQVDELMVFKQSDTDQSASPGVPHSSFFNPYVSSSEPPRESIEARAIVYYD